MDFGIFTAELINNSEPSKSHFFSNSILNFNNKFFENSDLEINFEQVSNDTYIIKDLNGTKIGSMETSSEQIEEEDV